MRDHVWVKIGSERAKYEDENQTRAMELKKISKDPTESQVKEATLRVASFDA